MPDDLKLNLGAIKMHINDTLLVFRYIIDDLLIYLPVH